MKTIKANIVKKIHASTDMLRMPKYETDVKVIDMEDRHQRFLEPRVKLPKTTIQKSGSHLIDHSTTFESKESASKNASKPHVGFLQGMSVD